MEGNIISADKMVGARLYASRWELVLSLVPSAARGTIAEVGVAFGDFSKQLIAMLDPRQFWAVDDYRLHEYPEIWGMKTAEKLEDMSHLDWYRKEMTSFGNVMFSQGKSWDVLSTFEDGFFDFVYLDADHSYDSVKKDLAELRTKVKPGGYLVCDDYTMWDPILRRDYGVVQAVNEFVAEVDCKVVGFSLHSEMFCNIAIRMGG